MNLHNVQFILSAARPADFKRDGLPQIVFSGKSNVGKSSVINRILQRKNFARVGESPGKTVHINYFLIDEKAYLVDLPGYGYAKVPKSEKERWAKLMERYFAEDGLITLGIMIVDARHKPTENDVIMANWFKASGCRFLVVANKLDKLKKSEIEPNMALIRQTLALPEEVLVLPFSAEKGEGRERLVAEILAACE
ncbi:MAG: YihA family ribosome biogenesis GTP-binding protein [Ruminococcaceae bacterium]|nr:YihA family ribosome biogenesis GTP-binding protein [Oscillospiraceae bacterium]